MKYPGDVVSKFAVGLVLGPDTAGRLYEVTGAVYEESLKTTLVQLVPIDFDDPREAVYDNDGNLRIITPG